MTSLETPTHEPDEPTPDGVVQALTTAVAAVHKIGHEFTEAGQQFWRFDDAVRYISLAASYKLVAQVIHKLDANSIANGNSPVIVSKPEFDQLVAHSVTLAKLRAGGVDNWEGYDHALGNGND